MPSGTAFIERFFSVCGIVCNKRNASMKADLIITKSMLRANIKLFEELNKIEI